MEFQRRVEEVGERGTKVSGSKAGRLWKEARKELCAWEQMQGGKCGRQRGMNKARAQGCDRKRWGKGSRIGGRRQGEREGGARDGGVKRGESETPGQ